MCRREKHTPKVDRKWLKLKRKLDSSKVCLGCDKAVVTRLLHKHEEKCVKYRDLMDGKMEEDARMRRVQAEQYRATATDMETRLEIQSDVMEQMETQIDELDALVTHLDTERQVYRSEQARILNTMDSLASPLYSAIRSLDRLYAKISSARASLRASTSRHELRRRRAIELTTQVSVGGAAHEHEQEHETMSAALLPPPPHHPPPPHPHHSPPPLQNTE
jgi:phage shock protein A